MNLFHRITTCEIRSYIKTSLDQRQSFLNSSMRISIILITICGTLIGENGTNFLRFTRNLQTAAVDNYLLLCMKYLCGPSIVNGLIFKELHMYICLLHMMKSAVIISIMHYMKVVKAVIIRM